jgi:predicted alpha-1,2-mannosidase
VTWRRALLSVGASALACSAKPSPRAAPDEPASYVDPFIGTGGHGHTFPGPTLPFGMIQPGPDTRLTGWDGCSGYHFDDRMVHGFSHTHLSGTGVSDYGDVLLLPATGAPRLRPGGEGDGSRFRKATEKAEPGYYRVTLDDYGVEAELTATLRTGWHRYTFGASESAHLLVDLRHRDPVLESSIRIADDHTIEGMRRSKAWAADQVVYFVASFSRPFAADSTLVVDDVPRPGLRQAAGKNLQAVLRYRTRAGERILAKVAISAVDVEGARRNLAAEAPGWDFDRVRAAARAAWNRALGAVEVEGGTRDQRVVFYTALYHALLAPNVFQDVDGRYRGLDRGIHRADGYTRHTIFSLWDTFRAAHPLYTILQRRRTVDFVRTFLEMYRESGRLPVWELAGNETDCMIGYHAVSVILDAWAKGIRSFDPALALEAMKATAEGPGFGLPAYRRQGFLPAEDEAESVSRTLEYAYDDWCIGRFAEMTGRPEDARRYLARSQGWQHLLDPSGFMRPRLDGRWLAPFDPAEVTFHYTEANAWQYSFFVPHDVAAWMARLGGPRALESRLDSLFAAPARTTGRDQPDITGLLGQYAHGNEPSHHMAYLYAFAGAPAKTQALVHRLVGTMYAARPDGLAGNEDCGQMSSWFVLSALGFYPVTPGVPEYVLGTPLFDRTTLVLEDGRRFIIRAHRPTPEAFYVQSVSLDGRPHPRAVLSHQEILAGGELVFELGPAPSSWGSGEGDRPVTAVTGAPVTPAPVAEGPSLVTGQARLALVAADPGDAIYYTRDGRVPDERSDRYTAPLAVTAPATLSFRAVRGGVMSPVVQAPVHERDPLRRIRLESAPNPQYTGGGNEALIDGLRGGLDFRLGRWQAFTGVELAAEIDLGRATDVHRLGTGFLQDQDSWIFLPHEIGYDVSLDGRRWRPAGSARHDVDPHEPGRLRRELVLTIPTTRARYVRLRTRSFLQCPAWHKGAGGKAHLFADEISVE